MNGTQNGMNNSDVKYCLHCGTLNSSKNRFCITCGATLNLNAPIQQTSIQPSQQLNHLPVSGQQVNSNLTANNKSKTSMKFTLLDVLMIVLAIASVVLCAFFYQIMPVVVILGFVSLFFRKTRWYGLGVMISFGLFAVICVILVVVLFGMCFAALGGL